MKRARLRITADHLLRVLLGPQTDRVVLTGAAFDPHTNEVYFHVVGYGQETIEGVVPVDWDIRTAVDAAAQTVTVMGVGSELGSGELP